MRRTAVIIAVAGLAASLVAVPGATGRTVASTNPLVGHPWGVYKGGQDGVYPAWQQATGTQKKLLAKVALRPRARWYGSWLTPSQVRTQVHNDIVSEQHGDPSVIVPVAMFRLWPHHESHKSDPLSKTAQQASARRAR